MEFITCVIYRLDLSMYDKSSPFGISCPDIYMREKAYLCNSCSLKDSNRVSKAFYKYLLNS